MQQSGNMQRQQLRDTNALDVTTQTRFVFALHVLRVGAVSITLKYGAITALINHQMTMLLQKGLY